VTVAGPTSSGAKRPVSLFAKPGELGLHRIYQTVAEWPKDIRSLLKGA
jgi:hypothetical protein